MSSGVRRLAHARPGEKPGDALSTGISGLFGFLRINEAIQVASVGNARH
jgi:hypothetical protein